jgi:hypothetical protein
VTILNETDAALVDVELTYSHGERRAERLAPGGVATSDIRCYGDSGLTLSYSQGNMRKSMGLAYIETGYRGSQEVHVRYEGVRLVDDIEIGPYPGGRLIPMTPTGEMTIVKPR